MYFARSLKSGCCCGCSCACCSCCGCRCGCCACQNAECFRCTVWSVSLSFSLYSFSPFLSLSLSLFGFALGLSDPNSIVRFLNRSLGCSPHSALPLTLRMLHPSSIKIQHDPFCLAPCPFDTSLSACNRSESLSFIVSYEHSSCSLLHSSSRFHGALLCLSRSVCALSLLLLLLLFSLLLLPLFLMIAERPSLLLCLSAMGEVRKWSMMYNIFLPWCCRRSSFLWMPHG